MSELTNKRPWLIPMRSWLVRVYKTLGLLALIAILVGLVGFLVVNVFYLFDRSWIRPEILSPTHERVVELNARMANERARLRTLKAERDNLEVEHNSIGRLIEANLRFEAQFRASHTDRSSDTSHGAMLAWRELDRSVLERERAAERRKVIEREFTRLDEGIAQSERLIQQLAFAPGSAARDGEITVAFVPYENLSNVTPKAPIYGCKLGLVWCVRIGTMGQMIEGEISNSHPHSGVSLRGVMFEIELTEQWAAEEQTLFVGGRPFWLL